MIDKSEIESWATRLPPSKLRTTILELLSELESARNAALEEAARVVEARFIGFRVDDADLTEMAAEIRALATNASTEASASPVPRAQGGITCDEIGGSSPADAGGLTPAAILAIAQRHHGWGMGFRPDSRGAFTIPYLPSCVVDFTRDIERALLATKAAQPADPALEALLRRIDESWANYERMGEVCSFEGQPMMYVSTLAEIVELSQAVGASPAPSAKQEAKLTVRGGIWWPEGYCTDPDGRIVAPKGKHTDFKFGHDIGYKDGLVAHKDSVAAIEERVRANLSAKSASASPAAPEATEMRGKLTQAEARKVLDLSLDLEKTGRICSLSDGQERTDFVARNRAIQTELQDLLQSLTEPTFAGAVPVEGSQQVPDNQAGTWLYDEQVIAIERAASAVESYGNSELSARLHDIIRDRNFTKATKFPPAAAAAPAVPVPVEQDQAQNAARYRWLRNPEHDVAFVLDKVREGSDGGPFGGGVLEYEYRAGEELDAAIDAAMAAPSLQQGKEGSQP